MATTAKGMYHPYAHHRGATVGSFQIQAGVTPVVLSDPGGIVSSVAKTGVGIYVVTLKRNYSKIHAVPNTDTVNRDVKANPIVAGGTVANTVTLIYTDKAGMANDSLGVIATVAFYGYDS